MKTTRYISLLFPFFWIAIAAQCAKPFPESDSSLFALQDILFNNTGTTTSAASKIDYPGNTALFTSESGTVTLFEIVLKERPTDPVTIPFNVTDATEELISTDSVTYGGSVNITFTSANWNYVRTLYIQGQDDAVADGNVISSIIVGKTNSADPLFNGLDPSDIPTVNFDNEIPVGTYGIAVAPLTGLSTSENGITTEFAIILQGKPDSDVTIGLSSSDTTEGTVSPSSVTIPASSWDTPVSVQVTGVDDSTADGDVTYKIITAPAVSSDPNYSGINPGDPVITNVDDENSGVFISTGALVTSEDPLVSPVTFQMVLTNKPLAPVTITVISDDSTEGLLSLDNITYDVPVTLTFKTNDWNSPQTVYVKGVADGMKDGDTPYTIITGAAISSDPYFNGANAPDISVTNLNID